MLEGAATRPDPGVREQGPKKIMAPRAEASAPRAEQRTGLPCKPRQR